MYIVSFTVTVLTSVNNGWYIKIITSQAVTNKSTTFLVVQKRIHKLRWIKSMALDIPMKAWDTKPVKQATVVTLWTLHSAGGITNSTPTIIDKRVLISSGIRLKPTIMSHSARCRRKIIFAFQLSFKPCLIYKKNRSHNILR